MLIEIWSLPWLWWVRPTHLSFTIIGKRKQKTSIIWRTFRCCAKATITWVVLGSLWEFGGEWKKWRALRGGDFVFVVIQNPCNLENLKIVFEKRFWSVLEGLGKFFKSNIYCYNTCKIKNTSIKSILLSFTRKTHSYFFWKIFLFSPNLIPPKPFNPFPSQFPNKILRSHSFEQLFDVL